LSPFGPSHIAGLEREGILIEQRGQLDLDYLEDWLSQFAEALEQPEIVAQYRDIQERIAAVLVQIQDEERHEF